MQKKRKGPVHLGMLRPTVAKHAKLVKDTCTTYKGPKFNGLPRKEKAQPTMTIKQYKDTVRDHMIQNGMWDIFNIPNVNPTSQEKYINLFKNHALDE